MYSTIAGELMSCIMVITFFLQHLLQHPLSFQTSAIHTKALTLLVLISTSPNLAQTFHVLYDFLLPELHLTFFQNKTSMAWSFQDGLSSTLSTSPSVLSLYPLICLIISARRTELISAVGYLYFKSFSSRYLTDPFLCLLPVCLVFEAVHLTFICCQYNLLLPHRRSETCRCTHTDEIVRYLLKLELSKDNQQHSITRGRVPRILCK